MYKWIIWIMRTILHLFSDVNITWKSKPVKTICVIDLDGLRFHSVSVCHIVSRFPHFRRQIKPKRSRIICRDVKLGELFAKKVRKKSRECHNHKPQPFQDPMRKRKPTNLNKHKPNKRTKSTKISSLSFPSEVIAILKGLKNTRTKWHTERHKQIAS